MLFLHERMDSIKSVIMLRLVVNVKVVSTWMVGSKVGLRLFNSIYSNCNALCIPMLLSQDQH